MYIYQLLYFLCILQKNHKKFYFSIVKKKAPKKMNDGNVNSLYNSSGKKDACTSFIDNSVGEIL